LHCSLVKFTTSRAELKAADFSNFIVSVPTSIEGERRPDLGAAAQSLGDMGEVMRKGAIVVCESTVYPGGHKETAAGARAAIRPDVTSPWAIA
jgi:UDP-N-acetyl-D-galactosamine dehydrogenase